MFVFILELINAAHQSSIDLTIPLWIWIFLGILFLAIILGLILGEKMAKKEPGSRSSLVNPTQIGLIPQTGGEYQPEKPNQETQNH